MGYSQYKKCQSGCSIRHFVQIIVGWGSVVGIATCYGLDGPGIESQWGGGKIFHTPLDWPLGPSTRLYNGYLVIPRGKEVGAWC